jgi:hypothetical protein
MFNGIVESVLNEIDASVAYNNYYTSIPQEDFNRIISAYGGKYDKFMKFLMDSIRDGDTSVEEALELVNTYVNADNNVRMAASNRFKNNEYEFPIQMLRDIQVIQKTGVTTEKSLYTEGMITVFKNEICKITLTATYAANHHFFNGITSWCTASDRGGKYDGWQQFMNYTVKYTGYGGENEQFEVKASLIQIEIFKTDANNPLYQVQVYRNGDIGLCCNRQDEKCSFNDISKLLPKNALIIKTNAEKFCQITDKLLRKEYAYQSQRDDYAKLLKQKREERRLRKSRIINYQCLEANTGKIAQVENSWKEFIQSNLIKSPEFLNEIIKNSDDYNICFAHAEETPEDYEMGINIINMYEKTAQTMHYAYCTSYDDIFYLGEDNDSRGYAVLRIIPILGKIKAPLDINNDSDVVIGDYFHLGSVEPLGIPERRGIKNMLCILAKMTKDEKVESVIKILENFDVSEKFVYIAPLRFLNNWDFNYPKYYKYFILSYGNDSVLYDAETLKQLSMPSRIDYGSLPKSNGVVSNEKINNIIMFDDADNNVYLVDINKFKLIGSKYNRLYALNYSNSFVLSEQRTNQIMVYSSVKEQFYPTHITFDLNCDTIYVNFMESRKTSNVVVVFNKGSNISMEDFMVILPEGKYLIRNCSAKKYRYDNTFTKYIVETQNGTFYYDLNKNMFFKKDPWTCCIEHPEENEITPQQLMDPLFNQHQS